MAPSVYRGANNTQTNKNLPQSTTKSFAHVTKKNTQFPQKDQAVLQSLYDIPLKDYIKTIENAIQATNFPYASRIFNDRICIYQRSKNIVDLVVNRLTYRIKF